MLTLTATSTSFLPICPRPETLTLKVLRILQGKNICVVDKAGGERPVMKGEFVLVLPDEKHQYKNASAKDPMVMICAVPKEYE